APLATRKGQVVQVADMSEELHRRSQLFRSLEVSELCGRAAHRLASPIRDGRQRVAQQFTLRIHEPPSEGVTSSRRRLVHDVLEYQATTCHGAFGLGQFAD